MLKAIIISALLLFSCGHAQVDEASRLILDYANAKASEAVEAALIPEDIETMLLTTTMQFESPFQGELETVNAIDVINERVGSISSLTYEDTEGLGFQKHFIYDKGHLTGASTSFLEDGSEEMVFSAIAEAALSKQFEAMFTIKNKPVIPEYSYARYMGRYTYGGILEGIQINIVADNALAKLPGIAEPEMGLIFNNELEMIGMATSASGVALLTVYSESGLIPRMENPLEITQYFFEEASGSVTLQSVTQMSYTFLNEPLDPALFELP